MPVEKCQSCAMPLENANVLGTNIDGTPSDEYCQFCFKQGAFTDEGITLEGKTDKLVEIAVAQMGMPSDQARELAEEVLPTLKRWKKHEHP